MEKQYAFLPADRTNFCYGLDGADLVVGEHTGHQTGVLPDSSTHLPGRHDAIGRDVQQGHCKALLLQGLEGVEDGVVFIADLIGLPVLADGEDGPKPVEATANDETEEAEEEETEEETEE